MAELNDHELLALKGAMTTLRLGETTLRALSASRRVGPDASVRLAGMLRTAADRQYQARMYLERLIRDYGVPAAPGRANDDRG